MSGSFFEIWNAAMVRGAFSAAFFLWLLKFTLLDEYRDRAIRLLCLILAMSSVVAAAGWLSVASDWEGRATGPYAFLFWFLIGCYVILPLLLLWKRAARKPGLVIGIALLMNAGWLFERWVIVITSLHRDFAPGGWDSGTALWDFIPVDAILAGLAEAIALVVVAWGWEAFGANRKDDGASLREG